MAANADITTLQTEGRNPNSVSIDKASTQDLCRIINNEDATIPGAVQTCIPTIAAAIDALTPRVRAGGRVLYVGAGTSGRLGVLDASEIPPTFSALPSQFVALIAGGDVALRSAQEGAEDSVEGAVKDLEALEINGELDSLIGIAASGRTPYVLSSLAFAKAKGCVTVGIACSAPSPMSECGHVDFMVDAVTGPEVVAGSTRMKAGTATKLILNMISTGVMIRTGKTFGNIMIDVKSTNVKLQMRARRILRHICGDRCLAFDGEIDQILEEADRSVKLAAAKLMLDVSINEARQRLENANGVLADLLIDAESGLNNAVTPEEREPYVLCVDGGGSKGRAVVANRHGQLGRGEAGPCNPNDLGIEGAVAAIALAIENAISSHPEAKGSRVSDVHFVESAICIAGIDREPLQSRMRMEMVRLLGETSGANMYTMNDLELLASIAGREHAATEVVVLVAGTGSVAMRYRLADGRCVRIARAGGWGALLGDEGSGFDVGRKAIRLALQEQDVVESTHGPKNGAVKDPLHELLTSHFRSKGASQDQHNLLDRVLVEPSGSAASPSDTKRRVAACAQLVLDSIDSSPQARMIVDSAAADLGNLARASCSRSDGAKEDRVLVLAGGLMHSTHFRKELVSRLVADGIASPGRIAVMTDLATSGALHMVQERWR
ncbi:uncharacterized protein LTR77_009713 [Saxophila tyrrhenica]|uniref:N-acetyl-D-glucosamine kinase n=1 Tax=Saxophila tyrrhenica TaxID=1690608 RepID=A0AAV9NZT8_9PEZI|nr:hypothetical protein LTR77_009713 [Saxophila tyrrhenica]